MNNSEIRELYHSSAALLSKCTVENRDSFLRELDKDIDKPFVELTAIDLRNYIIAKKTSGKWTTDGTVGRKIALMKGFFKFLVDENIIKAEANPTKNLKSPRQSKYGTLKTMDVKEIRNLMRVADSSVIEMKNKTLFYLAMTTGLRANEICSIKKANIDIKGKLIFIPKEDVKGHYREKLVPISPHTQDLIDIYISKYPNNTEYLFVNRFGRRIAPHAVYRAMKEVIDMAYPYKDSWKKPFGPHVARHTFASRWIESGGDYHALRAIMGWTSFSEMDRYVTVSPKFISQAASKVERKLLKV